MGDVILYGGLEGIFFGGFVGWLDIEQHFLKEQGAHVLES